VIILSLKKQDVQPEVIQGTSIVLLQYFVIAINITETLIAL